MKSKSLAAVAALALMSTSAIAGDGYGEHHHAFSWTGLYVGGQAGWASADYDHSYATSGHYNLAAGDRFDYGKSGGIGGVQAGYNYQTGQFVLGLEASLVRAGVGAKSVVSPFFPTSDRWSSSVGWIAALTPRAGIAIGQAHAYVKGGIAFTKIKDSVQDGFDFVESSTTRTGWTLGAGLEYALSSNWVLGIEYDRYDFGSLTVNKNSTNFAGVQQAFGTNHRVDTSVDAVTARINYKF